MEYIRSPKKKNGCVFCLKSFDRKITAEDTKRLVVYKGNFVYVMLNRYPYAAGHLMVIPYRHCMDLTDLLDEERNEFMDVINLSCKAFGRFATLTALTWE
jgi:ATP adenylyltransferase